MSSSVHLQQQNPNGCKHKHCEWKNQNSEREEKWKERDKERKREYTHTHRERQTDTDTHTHTETDRHRHTHTHRAREREREREREEFDRCFKKKEPPETSTITRNNIRSTDGLHPPGQVLTIVKMESRDHTIQCVEIDPARRRVCDQIKKVTLHLAGLRPNL